MTNTSQLGAAGPATATFGASSPRALLLRLLATLSFPILVCAGCQPPVDEHGERILDTVEVEAGATSAISFEEDEKAVRRDLRGESQLAGVLPGGFPSDLPLPLPASVVGYGDEDDRWVELSVPRSVREIEIFLERRWASAGWSVIDGGWQSGDRRVEAWLGDSETKGESLLRIAYR